MPATDVGQLLQLGDEDGGVGGRGAVELPVAPLLDEAVAQLNDPDRNAVVLRFYQHKPLNEVANILGVDPDTAQKRVSRAVDKLGKFFNKRGITLTASALGATITANSVQAVPEGLALTISAATVKGRWSQHR